MLKIKPARLNGRRGIFQLLFASVYVVLGASFILSEPTQQRTLALAWVGELVPYLGYVWIVGALAALTGMCKDRGNDSYSFATLTFAPLVFGGFFLVGVLTGAPTSGLVSTAIYWLIGAAVMVVSGMQGDNDRCARNRHEP